MSIRHDMRSSGQDAVLPVWLARLCLPSVISYRLLLVSLVGMSLAFFGAAGEAKSRPNIIFVLVDDMEAVPLSYMYSTKTLIRQQGAHFTSAYFAVPLCAPSRATILTGKYP